MKTYSNKIKPQENNTNISLPCYIFKNIPDDILLHIATFLNNRDKKNFKQLNKFISNNYHTYLDISDSVAISCYRNNIKLIEHYFPSKKTQQLIFSHLIKNSQMTIFNKLPLHNLFYETYQTIIIKCCIYNSFDIIKLMFDYIKSIEFDIIYVKNVFDNRFYKLFNLLYELPNVYNAPLNSIFVEACALGQVIIVKKMLANPNINPTHNNNQALNYAVQNKQYQIVEILINDNRIDQNMTQNSPLRYAVKTNNLQMVKLLFTDYRLDINDLNLLNVNYIIDKPIIYNYIINSDKVIYNFINSCIYSNLIYNNNDKIKELIKHPQFRKNTIFPSYHYDHILLSKVNVNDIEILDILIDINNTRFIYAILERLVQNQKYHTNNTAFKLLISFIMTKVNNKDYILTSMLDILSNNAINVEKIKEILEIIINTSSYFDTAYSLGYYYNCKKYIKTTNDDISEIFKDFYKGKYNRLAKMFLNYY